MKHDDGRLWVAGALGLLAVAGAVRRKGSAYEILDSMGEDNDMLGHGGETVIRYKDGRIVWVRVGAGLDDHDEADLAAYMDQFLSEHGIPTPRPPDPNNVRDLFAYFPLRIWEIDVPDEVSWAFEHSRRSPEAQALHLFVHHYAGAMAWAEHEAGGQMLQNLAVSDDPLDRVVVLEVWGRAHGFDRLIDQVGGSFDELTPDEIIARYPHLGRKIVRRSFRGTTEIRLWENR